MYGAYRPAMEGINYWRFANFLMPFYAMTPPGVLGLEHKFRAWVPMDDTHTLAISSNQRSPLFGPNGERPKGKWASGATDVYPNGTGFFDRFRCVADMDNDFWVDREAQKTKSFAGLKSIFLEDQAVTVSMGPVVDREKERLGTSDQMIIRSRRRLLRAARSLQGKARHRPASTTRRSTPCGPAAPCCPSAVTGTRPPSTCEMAGSTTRSSTALSSAAYPRCRGKRPVRPLREPQDRLRFPTG